KVGDRIYLSLDGFQTDADGYNGVFAAIVVSSDSVKFKPKGTPSKATITRTGGDAKINCAGSRTKSTYDNVGNLLSTTDAYGHETQYAYDYLDRKIRQTLPQIKDTSLQAVTLYRYDANNQLTSVTDPKGSDKIIHNLKTDAECISGHINTTTYDYDGMGRKITETSADPDPNGNGTADIPVTHYTYDAGSNLTQTRRERAVPRDDVSVTAYDQFNRAIATGRDARLATLTVSATVNHHVNVNLPSHGFKAGDYVLATNLPAGGIYDNVVKVVSATTNSFVAEAGNLALPLGQNVGTAVISSVPTFTSFDASGNTLSVQDPRGNVTTYLYDNINRKTRQTLPTVFDGTGNFQPVTTYEYDPNGNVIKTIDPAGNMANYNSVDRQDHATITDYDALNRKLKVYFPKPDASGARPTSSFGYDLSGNLISETDARNQITVHAFDALNREVLTQLPDADGSGSDNISVTTAAFDPNGNKMFVTSARGNETTVNGDLPVPRAYTSFFQYDSLNRQVASIAPDPNGSTPNGDTDSIRGSMTATDYDLNGNVLGTVDAIALDSYGNYYSPGTVHSWVQSHYHSESTEYDDLNRPHITYTSDADSGGSPTDVPSTTFTYDKVGNTLTRTDSSGTPNTTTYTYDELNRVTNESTTINSGAVERKYTYDSAGNVVSVVNRNGQKLDYTYDALNRKTHEEWRPTVASAADHTADYTYDVNGRRINASDNNSSYTYGYDYLDRLKTVTRAAAGGASASVVTYDYNAAGQAIHMNQTVGGNSNIDQHVGYDAQGRITGIRQNTGSKSEFVVFHYDADGNRTSIQRQNGSLDTSTWPLSEFQTPVLTSILLDTTYAFDEEGRLTSLTHKAGTTLISEYRGSSTANTPIAYDPNGRITDIYTQTPQESREGQYHYDYDANDQLLTADFPGTTRDENHSYDNEGNRTDAGYSTGKDNRLTADGKYTYTYDNEGNLKTRSDGTTYSYDEGNRLTQITGPGYTATYTYDVDGNRIAHDVDYTSSSVPDLHERNYYDGGGRLISVSNSSNTVVNRYLQGPNPDEPMAEERVASSGADHFRWMLPDQLGSIRDVADSTGTRVNHIVYDAFGGVDKGASTPGAVMSNSGASMDEPGTEDPNWTVDGEPAVITTRNPSWVGEPDGARWISFAEATDSDPGDVTRSFTTTVTLPSDVPASQLKLMFQAASDDNVTNILVNGNPTGKTVGAYGGWTEVTLTAANGLVAGQNTITFQVYNQPHYSSNPTGLIVNWFPGQATERFMYTGQEHDVETDLTYMNARYYDPAVGRFINQDPIGFKGGFNNLYSYVGNNTINATDPTGEFWWIPLMFATAMFAPAAVGAIAEHNGAVRDTLADFGGWLGRRFGAERQTIPFGFGSISFGSADDGTETFGFSTSIPIAGGPISAGSNMMIVEGPNGNSVGYGPNWGIGVNGFGYQFSYTSGMGANLSFSLGSWGGGPNAFGASPSISVGPHGSAQYGVALSSPIIGNPDHRGFGVQPTAKLGYNPDANTVSVGASANIFRGEQIGWHGNKKVYGFNEFLPEVPRPQANLVLGNGGDFYGGTSWNWNFKALMRDAKVAWKYATGLYDIWMHPEPPTEVLYDYTGASPSAKSVAGSSATTQPGAQYTDAVLKLQSLIVRALEENSPDDFNRTFLFKQGEGLDELNPAKPWKDSWTILGGARGKQAQLLIMNAELWKVALQDLTSLALGNGPTADQKEVFADASFLSHLKMWRNVLAPSFEVPLDDDFVGGAALNFKYNDDQEYRTSLVLNLPTKYSAARVDKFGTSLTLQLKGVLMTQVNQDSSMEGTTRRTTAFFTMPNRPNNPLSNTTVAWENGLEGPSSEHSYLGHFPSALLQILTLPNLPFGEKNMSEGYRRYYSLLYTAADKFGGTLAKIQNDPNVHWLKKAGINFGSQIGGFFSGMLLSDPDGRLMHATKALGEDGPKLWIANAFITGGRIAGGLRNEGEESVKEMFQGASTTQPSQ
ncbi:MAG TPA: RHS repeat-associated core domain-containing protein, partial [Tepidisphaeraceae bacterium]